jgi:glutathione S-transferase
MRQLVPAIEKKLGDGPYLLGEKLTVFDFGIASLLAGTLDNQPGTWATALVKEFQPVVDYAESVQAAVGVYCREVV